MAPKAKAAVVIGAKVDPDVEDELVLPAIPSDDRRSRDPEVWDLVVIGAGVAGAAFAYQQGRDGRRVLVLERDLKQPDRIIGELLQPGGYLALKRLGLGHTVEGIDAQEVAGYCMFKDGRVAKVAYPAEGGATKGASVSGRSFHNGRFVQRMRAAVAELPSVTIRQAVAKSLVNGDGGEWEEGQVVTGVRYRMADGQELEARAHLTVACDGMYSNLRSKLAVPDVFHPSYFIGLLLKDCTLPHPGYGHVVLADPSPILFYPISSTEVRCLVDYPGPKLPSATTGALQAHLLQTMAPQLPPSLRAAFEKAVECGRIRAMQNKQVTCAPLHVPGALLLGDSFNMRHPLTGGGMTVAFADTRLLCDLLRPLPGLGDPVATADATAAFYVRRKPVSATINTLANALYRVFCADGTAAHEEMRSACFDYLALGGAYSAGPISLLSGLNPRPSVLVGHFFMVALYGVGRLLWPRPTLHGLWMGLLLLHTAASIIFPIIRAEGIRAVFFPKLASQPRVSGHMRRVASHATFVAKKAA